jgi:hypothetical protein
MKGAGIAWFSSGAVVATQETLDLLARQGMSDRVFSAGVLATLELPTRRFQAVLERGRSVEVTELAVDGLRGTLMPTASIRPERSPDPRVGMFRAQEE